MGDGHNEVSFAPEGTSEGKSYSVSIKGIFVKDKDYPKKSKYHVQPRNAELHEISQIEKLASELNLPVIKLSAFVSKRSEFIGVFEKESSFPSSPPAYEEATDQWGRPMSDPNFGFPPAS